jgi:SAM-dependent methyltransferase
MGLSIAAVEAKIPSDHSRQATLDDYLDGYPDPGSTVDVLDLGCGMGKSYDTFKKRFRALNWTGVDVEDSPEVRRRTRTDCRFVTYDGVNLPFAPDRFDLILCQQVFEHVRHPEPLLREVARVLRPGGVFVGSVSQLEPFHSYSLWNFTYYGFATIAHDAGLELHELRPGIDGMTLIVRSILKFGFRRDVGAFARFFNRTSPLNGFFETLLGEDGADHRRINGMKLRYCGHFWFKFGKLDPPV